MRDCDTLLTVGSSFPYTQFLPELDQARAVQIDIDAKYIGMRYPYEVNLVGDAAATLRALIPHLTRKDERSWRDTIESNITRWWEVMDAEAMVSADPVNPMRLFHELSSRLPDNAIVTADSGSSANWYARQLKFRGDMRGSLSGNLATMGPGVPYGIGAKFANPDRPAIVFAGDGAMQMNGLAELITIAKYRERWPDQRLIVLVLNNRDLNQVTWEQRAMAGDPKLVASQQLPDVPYARWAELIGLQGIRTEDPAEIGDCWERALSADRPTLLEVVCDPEVPPLPPHITIEQAQSLSKAILHGDAGRRRIIAQSIRQKLPEIFAGG
jgi:pyruvate dehydrogenase (quinone)